ncbi:MAG TPA: PilN domain-containing protein [Nevskiaceae bacterium]
MTTQINLLDWRAERRVRRKKEFISMVVGTALVALIIAIAVASFINIRIRNQNARNTYLQQQIKQTDREIAEIKDLNKVRDNLLARMHVIETLQQDRSATVHFFDEVVNTLPTGVYLKSIKEDRGKVTFTGVAQSNGRVSAYMKNLDASPWFSNPRLVVIKTTESQSQRHSDFTLVVDVARPQQKAAGTVASAAAGGKS